MYFIIIYESASTCKELFETTLGLPGGDCNKSNIINDQKWILESTGKKNFKNMNKYIKLCRFLPRLWTLLQKQVLDLLQNKSSQIRFVVKGEKKFENFNQV